MSAVNQNDCPICMEVIDISRNCVTTECGHCFHANCLMKSVAHNGFGCPYCRTAMAEAVNRNDDDDDNEEFSEEEEEEEEEEERYGDNVLRGFRFFMNNVHGNPQDEDDMDDENDWLRLLEEQGERPKPSADYVHDKLVEQGVTMSQLVKILLRDHDEYDQEEDEFERVDDEVWGKLRMIITNYNPRLVMPPPVQHSVEYEYFDNDYVNNDNYDDFLVDLDSLFVVS